MYYEVRMLQFADSFTSAMSSFILKNGNKVNIIRFEFSNDSFFIEKIYGDLLSYSEKSITIKPIESKNKIISDPVSEDLSFLINRENNSLKYLKQIINLRECEEKIIKFSNEFEEILKVAIKEEIPEKLKIFEDFVKENIAIYLYDIPDDVYLLHKLNGDI